MTAPLPRPGLDAEGFLVREGSLVRVPDAFRPVVSAVRSRLPDVFGSRLHSAYLYGSVPRGTARAGHSDLDLLVALHAEPADADREAVRAFGAALDREFGQIDGVGTPLYAGFTLVMPRWRGWTSDLREMAGAFAASYPERAAQLRTAARYGHEPVGDPDVLRSYVDDLGPWLADEYARVHGVKAPRPAGQGAASAP
ncbi:nucleotidyltransferase domain-containing protein [Streptomyces sp. NPDC017086]|uniref:nucleotidyltransferase domain-containing protein n=1 Tax=Streptomyces sp. NPDC017086 TaxID=3364976 RepID=UPI0037A37CD1